jgi:tight adherence protein C
MKTTVEVLRLSSLVLVSITAFFATYASARRPTGEPVRLGLRGLKRRRLLEKSQLWRIAEPIARWLGRRTGNWLSETRKRTFDRKLLLSGDVLGMVPEELLGLSILTTMVGAGLGALVGALSGLSYWGTLGGAGYGAMAPYLVISEMAVKRAKTVGRRLPHAIDLLALSMSAGLDFPGAVRQIIDKSGDPNDPLIEELSLLLYSLGLGHTRGQALKEFARRAPCDAVVEFVGAVTQAEQRGTPVAEVLMIQGTVARRGRSNRAEEVAAKAGIKLLIPLAIIFVCVLALVVSPIVIRLTIMKG